MPTREDDARAALQSSIYDVLRDDWEELLRDWLVSTIGEERAAIWGKPDTSVNLLADYARQVTTPGLYATPPEVRGPPGARPLLDRLASAGVWTRQQHVEYLAVGMVDCLVRPQVDATGLVSARVVAPHNIYAVPHADDPTRPVVIWELRLRELLGAAGESVYLWTWDQYDVRRGREAYRIVAAEQVTLDHAVTAPTGEAVPQGATFAQGAGITHLFIDEAPPEGLDGDAYPFRDHVGRAFLPWVWYRSMDTGSLWGTIYRQGPYRGTLNAALLSTYTLHAARDATGSMTLVFNAAEPGGVAGLAGTQAANRSLPVSPGSLLFLRSLDGSQPSVSQIGPGANLQPLSAFARSYMSATASRFGVNSNDLTNLSNPQSAAALAISDRGRREFAERMAPLFRRADERLVRLFALLSNLATGANFHDEGYSVVYTSTTETPDEEKAQREQLAFERDAGLISQVDLWLTYHPGATRDDALAALTRVQADEARLARMREAVDDDAGVVLPAEHAEDMRAAVDELETLRERIADLGDDLALESLDEALRLIMGDDEADAADEAPVEQVEGA
jgi:hypothetical protein